MTTIDFLKKVYKQLDSQEYRLAFSPAKSNNFMLYCNDHFIGGLFNEELCFVYADSVSELLGNPEPCQATARLRTKRGIFEPPE